MLPAAIAAGVGIIARVPYRVAQLDGVSSVIPGARNVGQAESNAAVGLARQLSPEFTASVVDIYNRYFRAAVHPRW